jgi:hypothetical protein
MKKNEDLSAAEAFQRAKDDLVYNDGRDIEEIVLAQPDATRERDFSSGQTLLLLAAGRGLHDAFAFLLPHSDSTSTDVDGNTALMLAAEAGCLSVARLAFAGCSGRETNNDGEDALMRAMRGNNPNKEIVQELIPICDPRQESSDRQETALSLAATNASPSAAECLPLLIAAGWDPAHKTRSGPLLEMAASYGREWFEPIWSKLSEKQRKESASGALWMVLGLGADSVVADTLCHYAPRKEALAAMEKLGPQNTPSFAARIEAESLQEALSEAKADESGRVADRGAPGAQGAAPAESEAKKPSLRI